MPQEILSQRTSLLNRLTTWFEAEDSQCTLLLSAPKATGKTTALRAFSADKKVVYYEFRGGGLRKDQTASACLLSIARGIADTFADRIVGQENEITSRKVKQNPVYLDAGTLFEKYIVEILSSLKPMSDDKPKVDQRLLIVIDCPERCDSHSRGLLWDILCRRWLEQVSGTDVRLIIATSYEVENVPSLAGRGKMEVVTRMSSKGNDTDEVINEMFVKVISDQGDDPEWETDKIDALTKACHGSPLIAHYIIKRKLYNQRLLPSSIYEVFEEAYKPWFGPFLCARKHPVPLPKNDELLVPTDKNDEITKNLAILELLAPSNAFSDWFCLENRERCRKDGHAATLSLLAKNTKHPYSICNRLFHAMEAGDYDSARVALIDFSTVYQYAQLDLEMLLLDADAYGIIKPYDMTCRTIRNCLNQSRAALLQEPRQLPFQFLGRITGVASDLRGDVEISNFMDACRNFRSDTFSWFRPIRASMASVPEVTMRVMRGHADTILAVACTPLDSPLPKLALTGSYDGTAKLFDLQTGKCELTLYNQGAGYCSGCSIAALDENTLIALTSTEDSNSRVWYIAKGAGGYFSARNAKRFEMTNLPAHILIGHEKEVTGCAFMPRNPRIAVTCSADCTAKLWRIPLPNSSKSADVDPLCTKTFRGHTQAVLCVAFVPANHQIIATGSKDRTIRMWSILDGEQPSDDGQCLSVFCGHFANITCISFRSDGVVFATGGWDSICKVWSVSEALNQQIVDAAAVDSERTVEEKCQLVHKDWIWGVSFLETNRDLLATSTDNGIVRLWSISTSSCILAFDAHIGVGVYCIATMGADFLLTGSIDSTLRLFDVSKERCTGRITTAESWLSLEAPHRHQSRVRCAAFPAQNLSRRVCFLGSDDKSIRAFDLDTGRCIKRLPDHHQSSIIKILVSPDENSLKSIDSTGGQVTWNRSTFDLKEPGTKSFLSRLSSVFLATSCCAGAPMWRETGTVLESSSKPILGSFQPPPELYSIMRTPEELRKKPFITITLDSTDEIQCWCSPLPNSTQKSESVALVLTEKNGLVHILHPMI